MFIIGCRFFLRLPVSCNPYEFNLPVTIFPHDASPEDVYRYEIIPLMKGYSINTGQGEQKRSTSSSTLVKGSTNVIVNTGNPSEKEKILK